MDIIGGNIGKIEIKVTSGGKEMLKFSVAENKGFGATKETIWYDCTSWRTSLPLAQGQQVLVYGHKSQREFQGKMYNQLDVFHVEILSSKPGVVEKPVSRPATERESNEAISRSIDRDMTPPHLRTNLDVPF